MHERPVFFLLAALCACTPDLHFQGSPRFTHQPGYKERTDSTDINPSESSGKHIYLTAVRYPDGYDWELDTCAVEGTVWIDLYRDGERISSIPAGGSVHPDMHRFAGGHLYTDCSTDTETIVCQDGKELFRFDGREALRGFLVRDGAVHTLGQDRDGDGLTYRIDGHTVFRSETGTVLGNLDRNGREGGALMEDGEDLFYAYCTGVDGRKEYRVMRNAELFRTLPDGRSGSICDLLVWEGRIFRTLSTSRDLLLVCDDESLVLGLQNGRSVYRASIVPWQDGILALAQADDRIGRRYYILMDSGEALPFGTDVLISDILSDGVGMGWLLTDKTGTPVRFCFPDGNDIDIPADGFLASGRCALFREGKLFLALSGHEGAPGCLWQDGETTQVPFNGCFTSITVE